MRRWLWVVAGLGLIFLALSLLVAALLAEAAIHPARTRRPSDTAALASSVAQTSNATLQKLGITANDGVRLNAWWLLPKHQNDRAVIVCHGVGDSSNGALGFAPLFLKNGYSVLVPDSRGHGESSGFVTYGVLESGDLLQWVAWVESQGVHKVFGLRESLGAAVLIQSLAKGSHLQAIVAESSYSSFESIADERVGRVLPSPLAWLLVREAMLYVRFRYGIDLKKARPDKAIAKASVPILLIHGQADNETSPENSIRLARANPAFIRLWLVSRAKHTGAYAADPKAFEQKVLKMF